MAGVRALAHRGPVRRRETDWNQLAHQRVTFVPHGLTREDLISASKRAFTRFYLRPRIVLGFGGALRSLRGVRMLWLGFITLCKSIFARE